jgi:transposase-like protein
MSDLSKPQFHDETAAREWLESELWPDGPVCPHCGVVNQATLLQRGTKPRKNQPEQKRLARSGLYQCNACREPFTVTVGTLYERSHIPLNKWLAATHLMMASKKGMSALQISRMIGISYKSAWFMCHRIRESLRETKLTEPLGGQNKVVEADEMYVGGKEANKHASKRKHAGRGAVGKEPVVSLVERDGRVRSQHMPEVTAKNLRAALVAQVDRKSYLMTDESGVYTAAGRLFGGHGTVNHSIEEYVRGGFWHTNTVEGYFSIFKRGVMGTYHHVSQQHLKRYLAEFDYRYNERVALGVNDGERMAKSVAGIVGKRLTYRRTRRQQENDDTIPF